MGRPRLTWKDEELRKIAKSLVTRHWEHPGDNARFLDTWIEDVRVVTGQIYGAETYARLLTNLASSTRVTRRPSASVIQRAVLRARAADESLWDPMHGDEPHDARVLDAAHIRQALEPILQDWLANAVNRLASATRIDPYALYRMSPDAEARAVGAETALVEAGARLQGLEEENRALRQQLARAEARAECAEAMMNTQFAQIRAAIEPVPTKGTTQPAKAIHGRLSSRSSEKETSPAASSNSDVLHFRAAS